MNIHIVQVNKLNAKYHLHVQHLTNATILKQLHQGYKIQVRHKSTTVNAKH